MSVMNCGAVVPEFFFFVVLFTRREALSQSYAKTASASSQLVAVGERSPLLSIVARAGERSHRATADWTRRFMNYFGIQRPKH